MVTPTIVTRNGKKFVLVPAAEYQRMKRAAAAGSKTSPAAAVDAIAFADQTIAQSIVRDRNTVGLTQRDLAERAGIRVEVLNRAERGAVVPSVRTLTKIENALLAAGLKRKAL
jgi:ribosome-binding protein aMBF1 (putative translation factor)